MIEQYGIQNEINRLVTYVTSGLTTGMFPSRNWSQEWPWESFTLSIEVHLS